MLPFLSFTWRFAFMELQLKLDKSSFVIIHDRAGIGSSTSIQNSFENWKIYPNPQT
jgi:hypothetical protein